MLPYKKFIVFALTFRPVMWCEVGVQFHSFGGGNPVVSTPLVEKTVLFYH